MSRCACGVMLSLVLEEDHRQCRGVELCGTCGQEKPVGAFYWLGDGPVDREQGRPSEEDKALLPLCRLCHFGAEERRRREFREFRQARKFMLSGTKVCKACGVEKEIRTAFKLGGKGGVNGKCKACERVRDTVRYRERYRTDEEFREANKARRRAYAKEGPKSGVRRGRRPYPLPSERPCPRCEKVKPIAQYLIYGRYHRQCKPCFLVSHRLVNRRSYQRRKAA